VTSRLIRSIENYWEIPIMSSCTLNGMYLHHRLVLRRPKMRVAWADIGTGKISH